MRIFVACAILAVLNQLNIDTTGWIGVGLYIGFLWSIIQDIREIWSK